MWAGRLCFAAAMVILAFGLRREGSVVARRLPGVVALIVLGFAPPFIALITPSSANPDDLWMLQTVGYIQLAATGGAALLAVVEIARARVLPGPWRWAPAAGLAIVALVFVTTQIVGLSVGVNGIQGLAVVLAAGGWITGMLVPLVLGVGLMVLGARGLPAPPAQIYPSAG